MTSFLNLKLETTLISAAETTKWQQKMWDLYNQYYQVDPKSFFKRFTSNNLYAIYTCGEKLVGFTGFRINKNQAAKKAHTVYIGQTVMNAKFRGKSMIPRTCCLVFAKLFLKNPFIPIYVWCDALTYKPYLLFANSLETYYPSRYTPTPENVQEIILELGAKFYGENFNPENGTVHKPKNIIDDPSTVISEKERQNPDIDYYATCNPGHNNGNGLIVLAPITFRNFVFLIKKCLRKLWKR